MIQQETPVQGRREWAAITRQLHDARVMVTGGTGFIGGRLVEQLALVCGARPTVLLRGQHRAARLAAVDPSVTTTMGDIGDAKAVEAAAAGCSAVFHCAYDGDPDVNIRAAHHVVNACVRAGARLIHVSTYAVYLPRPSGELDEASEFAPAPSTYARNKIAVDRIIQAATQHRGLQAVTLLPTIVYGPHGGTWTVGPATRLLSGAVVLPDDGTGTCNQVYVDDVCQALIRAAAVDAPGGRYLISGSHTVTWRMFFEALAGALGCPGPRYSSLAAIPASQAQTSVHADRPGMPLFRQAMMSLRDRLGSRGKARLRTIYRYARRGRPAVALTAEEIEFYRSTCRVNSSLAECELGYRPEYAFDQGAAITGAWVRSELLGR